MFEFTKKSRKIIEVSAQVEARRLNCDYLGPEHIMLALLKDEDSVAARIMKNLGIHLRRLSSSLNGECKEILMAIL
jgi:ATP-dependent Clp protease ATP-binding subunit ClpC